jgi:two-component system cell cycle sensor histidine kinase/response regulator CckA
VSLILFVDDNATLRRLVSRLLVKLGHEVVVAQDGLEAVDHYSRHVGVVDLVILDCSMPQMDGPTCYSTLRKINPAVRALLATGYAGDCNELTLPEGVLGCLNKPFSLERLSSAIDDALAS